MKVAVCSSPALLNNFVLTGKIAVIVDILRASSTIITAIGEGVAHISPFATVEECAQMRQHDYLIAAEREGAKQAHFDLGNSPLSYLHQAFEGRKVAITTTNGTKALLASLSADEILIGAFLNISATARYLASLQKEVVIVCSGWKDNPCLEDTLYAGALAALLKKEYQYNMEDDSAKMAFILYKYYADNLRQAIEDAHHTQRLKHLGIEDDLDFVVQTDVYPIVAKLVQNFSKEVGVPPLAIKKA